MRELMNNLPEALGDVDDVPARGQHDDESMRTRLAAAYAAVDFRPTADADADAKITVPQGLLFAVRDCVADHDSGQRRGVLRDSAVVLGRLDPADASLQPWRQARALFMKLTHINRFSHISDEEIAQNLEHVEAALMTRLGDFFDVLAGIEDIVAQANRREGAGE